MDIISYNNLAKLHFADFLSETDETYVEESGMVVCVGLGGYEELGQDVENHFGWRQGEPYQTAEVGLSLLPESKLPVETARRIIKALGLPIDRGMTAPELINVFGKPISDKSGRPGLRLLKFICGDPDKYLLGCDVEDTKGLVSFFIARKDYCDENNAI